MISYEEALRLIAGACRTLEAAASPLEAALGLSPAGDVSSRMNVPSFDNSAMDGFALLAADTAGAGPGSPVVIPVAGLMAAGQAPVEGAAGHAVEIMTGAPLPTGYDTVIPVERVETKRDTQGAAVSIRCIEPVAAGRHIRRVGQDFEIDQKIVDRGRPLEPHHIMGLAATGSDTVETRRKPRVALITTGSELAATGIPAGGGLIRDANGPYLRTFFAAMRTERVQTRFASDDPAALQAAIAAGRDEADIVLTTGGVSAGRFDHVPDAIEALGGKIIFHKVAMRPGKPLLFARLDNGTLFFGLPGNPVAVAVGLRFFVLPALARLQGLADERFVSSICSDSIETRKDLTFFGKARAEIDANGCLQTRLLPGQESFRIHSLMQANCWAIVPEGTEKIAAGDRIQIAPLYPTGLVL